MPVITEALAVLWTMMAGLERGSEGKIALGFSIVRQGEWWDEEGFAFLSGSFIYKLCEYWKSVKAQGRMKATQCIWHLQHRGALHPGVPFTGNTPTTQWHELSLRLTDTRLQRGPHWGPGDYVGQLFSHRKSCGGPLFTMPLLHVLPQRWAFQKNELIHIKKYSGSLQHAL